MQNEISDTMSNCYVAFYFKEEYTQEVKNTITEYNHLLW